MFSTKDQDGTFWYCVTHHRVEVFADVDSENKIGPFATSDEAAHALQTIAEREKAYKLTESDED
ncbi:hypothetical protein SAMN05444157_1873 [Frankineae bacterium MT45]|nr:hypothetical protein SAMN05444157_1873 [Frankineae bacterium MT45]